MTRPARRLSLPRRCFAVLATVLIALVLVLPARAQAPGETGVLRIIGGSAASEGTWPSMVLVEGRMRDQSGNVGEFSCGGTVVGERWVLTAAHCLVGASSLSVVEGTTRPRAGQGRRIAVARAILHPYYTGTRFTANDIGLLELREASTQPRQKLLAQRDMSGALRQGRMATVIGFGTMDMAGTGPVADRLLQVDVPFVPREQCVADYRDWPAFHPGAFGDHSLCAGFREGGRDSCQGDSGGPLFMRLGTESVQVGVVSWGGGDPRRGLRCALPRRYGVYASVAHFERFIRQHVRDADFTSVVSEPANDQQAAPPPRPAPQPSPGVDRRCFAALDLPDLPPSELGQLTIDVVQGNRLRVGTLASFRIRSNVQGLLLVYAVNPAGQTVQLFPNQRVSGVMAGQAPPIIEAGRMILMPGPADGFRAVVEPPHGQGVVCAVVLPPNSVSRDAVTRNLDFQTIADPAAFERRFEAVLRQAPSPRSVAFGSRIFEVVP